MNLSLTSRGDAESLWQARGGLAPQPGAAALHGVGAAKAWVTGDLG